MDAFLVLLFGVVAGGCLVMFFHPQVGFRPIDDDVPLEALGRARWMFLGWSLMALGQAVVVAGGFANTPAELRLTSAIALLLTGFTAVAWSIRGLRRLKHERLRLMRERHAAELRELSARHDRPVG